jgi:hypothetical protein
MSIAAACVVAASAVLGPAPADARAGRPADPVTAKAPGLAQGAGFGPVSVPSGPYGMDGATFALELAVKDRGEVIELTDPVSYPELELAVPRN